MKNDIGYAVITIKEYKELVEDNINKTKCIEALNEVAFKRNRINEKLENYFFERLLDNENYHLENMKECNPTDYHYQKLYKRFLEIGIDNVEYIHTSIMTMKHNLDNREKIEEE